MESHSSRSLVRPWPGTDGQWSVRSMVLQCCSVLLCTETRHPAVDHCSLQSCVRGARSGNQNSPGNQEPCHGTQYLMYQALTFSHLRDHVLAEAPCVCGFTIIHILVLLDVKVKFLTLSLTHSPVEQSTMNQGRRQQDRSQHAVTGGTTHVKVSIRGHQDNFLFQR